MTGQRPSIGRVVHYVSHGTPGGEYGKECRAAIITEVGDFEPGSAEEHRAGEVGLCVLNPTGQFFNRGVRHHEAEETPGGAVPGDGAHNHPGGTWHWPERV